MQTRQLIVLLIWPVLFATSTALGQELIDVGGHKMEIFRAGSGGPTVVFEAGVIASSTAWFGVPSRVADFAETLSYSHYGIGKSDPASAPRSASQVAAELQALLKRIGAKPPYVLVGHSMGGLYARVFAAAYPTEIAGLVMIDAVHERQVLEFIRLDPNFPSRRKAGLDSLQPSQRAEMEGLAPILEKSGTLPGKVPDVPMVIITSLTSTTWAAGSGKLWRDLHDEMFRLTTNGMHIVTSKSGHVIQKDEPDLVVNAIRWVVEAARSRK